jgi:hypothetical protein
MGSEWPFFLDCCEGFSLPRQAVFLSGHGGLVPVLRCHCFAESANVPNNVYVADLYEEVSFLRDVHRQIADNPNGAKVTLRVGQPRRCSGSRRPSWRLLQHRSGHPSLQSAQPVIQVWRILGGQRARTRCPLFSFRLRIPAECNGPAYVNYPSWCGEKSTLSIRSHSDVRYPAQWTSVIINIRPHPLSLEKKFS